MISSVGKSHNHGVPAQYEPYLFDWRTGISDPGRIESAVLSSALASGIRVVPEVLGLDEFLCVVPALRCAMSLGMAISWRSETLSWLPTALVGRIVHLPPPLLTAPDAASRHQCERWTDQWRHGLLYYRRGPGFFAITDRRGGRNTRILIDIPHEVDAFESIVQGDIPERARFVHELTEAGLVVQTESRVTALPYRIKTWPTPYMGI